MAIEGLEILMSRLHNLSGLLRTQNIESDLIAGLDGDLPKLLIYFEQGDAYLTYVPMDAAGGHAAFSGRNIPVFYSALRGKHGRFDNADGYGAGPPCSPK